MPRNLRALYHCPGRSGFIRASNAYPDHNDRGILWQGRNVILTGSRGQCQYDPAEIYSATMHYASSVKTVKYDMFLPVFLSSIGSHIVNLANTQSDPFYTPNHKIPNLCGHLFAHGPPGFSKTFFQDFFFDSRTGIAYKSVPNYIVGNVTGAGFIGSYVSARGRPEKLEGLAERYPRHILCAEEFASLSSAMKQSHSVGLDAALLSFLDKGKVNYDMKFGVIDFVSRSTLWTGSQPERMDLASGIMRRLELLDFTPDVEDIRRYKESNLANLEAEIDWEAIENLRAGFYDLYNNFVINHIEIGDDVKEFLKASQGMHWEDSLHLRLAIGFTLMTLERETTTLEVSLSPTLKALLKRLYIWRHYVLSDPVASVILTEIKSKDWQLRDLRDHLATLGISRNSCRETIDYLVEDGVLSRSKSKGKTRPCTIISKGPEYTDIV